MIGTLGSIVFEVSDKAIRTPNKIKRSASAKWTDHAIMGQKPKSEFVAPENRQNSFEIMLDARFGVKPRQEIDNLMRMVEKGIVAACIIGDKPLSSSLYQKITGVSDTWDEVYSNGELVRATVSITLKDYE